MSDTAAQLLFDKENHISQLVVQTGAKHCVDVCNPEATKSLNARDKLKVQSKIEVLARPLLAEFAHTCAAGDAQPDGRAAQAVASVVMRGTQGR